MKIYKLVGHYFLLALFYSCTQNVFSQPTWKEVGTLKTRDAREIKASSWSIGGETLDRDYTDYQSYKKYLGTLGAKYIRLQGGWSKCEKQKGVYSFEWLDSIIPDAASRGVHPWVQLSYGNPIYEGGGEAKLAGHVPTSPEALAAWDNWVAALVKRYRNYVPEWEIWNEPDLNPTHTGEELGKFFLRTAKVIRNIQPDAKFMALGLCVVSRLDFVKGFMDYLKANDGLQYVNIFTYHGYAANPSTSYPEIEKLRQLVWSYKPDVVFMQGENGAPSTPKEVTIGALREYDWSELTQAKWDLRRMLGDHGRGIATNLFTISDIHYAPGDHMVGVNTKGILKTNPDKTIDRPKVAYYAAQRVFSLFDSQIMLDTIQPATDQSTVFAYQYHDKKTTGSIVTLWSGEARPADTYEPQLTSITVKEGRFKEPVYVDLINGKIYSIPRGNWKKTGDSYVFNAIPIPDYPVLIADKKALQIKY